MHRPTAAVLGLLQCMAVFACQLESEEVIPKSRRSIIGVPLFVGNRFGQRTVVGYDGEIRPMFEESVDDEGCCCSAYYSSQPSTAQPPTGPEKLRSVVNNDAWWLAVIENSNRNNKQEQQEMETKEEWRKYQCVSSCSQ
ncbi:uncharacterized protein LOC111031551 [Myzus persicae]|uniref:uncharacterized protein LOC111031551 n=1 Tax=Myzus persicae TaxID=13164 RepID=UPI000B935120|nr:uncharacterized protein LOC111031551 [Myzus persicae]